MSSTRPSYRPPPHTCLLYTSIVELAVYGLVSGVAYKALGCRMNRKRTYAALIIAMLAGRAANGLAMTAAMGMAGKAYTCLLYTSRCV